MQICFKILCDSTVMRLHSKTMVGNVVAQRADRLLDHYHEPRRTVSTRLQIYRKSIRQ